jgi:glycogen operon protein
MERRLGVTLAEDGAGIAVVSRHATRIEICLFDESDRETGRFILNERAGDVHSAFLPGVRAGQRYGLRAHGDFAPERGHRFDSAKLLVDPYARRLDRPFTHRPELMLQGAETARFVPKGIIERPGAAKRLRPSRTPAIIYEVGVRAFTMRHPDMPGPLRGTVAGLGHPKVIEHLVGLGIDTVELMPLAAWIDERHLPALGLRNGWGYNPVTFMAPDPRLAPSGFAEIRETVARLHEAGLQVILDVVYNHTGESDREGTTLSLRGLDEASYYRHDGSFRLINDTGCGNTVAAEAEPGLGLILDAMRAWASETGIDGFRFDLAAIFGRGSNGFSADAPFFVAVEQDPQLAGLILIAEPWDVGPQGYQLGSFPPHWLEWNDRYRDDLRRFWRGDRGMVGALATRISGSSDLFDRTRRSPRNSVNFLAAHDGFTLRDTVSYSQKHNEANGEHNRDGTNDNSSWNNGVEGDSEDAPVRLARACDIRAMLASLVLSRGTIMLTAGDEFGRSQNGNNNAYAQDNELTWLDWEGADRALLDFTRAAISLRQSHLWLAGHGFLTGEAADETGLRDVTWLRADGNVLGEAEWNDPERHLLGAAFHDHSSGERICAWFNAGGAAESVKLPAARKAGNWRLVFDHDGTADRAVGEGPQVAARSVAVFAERMEAKQSTQPKDRLIDELAAAAGIHPVWWTIQGEKHDVSIATKRALLKAMGLSITTARDVVESFDQLRRLPLPRASTAKCFLSPEIARGAKIFGLAAHVYALRGSAPSALGNFAVLGEFAATVADAGAAFAGINPLHHLFPTDRSRASPYQPSDRRFIDPIYIDVDAIDAPGEASRARTEAQRAIAALDRLSHVDYVAAWPVIRRVLVAIFNDFSARKPGVSWQSFMNFCDANGEVLHRHAVFECIADEAGSVDQEKWPRTLRHVGSSGVADFAGARQENVLFRKWLQWIADLQLGTQSKRGSPLYGDLALGTAFDGGEIWADPSAFAMDISLGAPPDPFSAQGQVWNLAPFQPHVLRERALAPYREIVRRNMRHCGMLRIDHVLGLMRQFWVPRGADGSEGAYVSFPLASLMAAVAEESHNAQCMVVGEDLGTVPEGLREGLALSNFLSYRVLWFERDNDRFRPPSAYPYLSLACLGSHDLPTFAGWTQGAHLELDHRLKRNPDEAKQRRDYEAERLSLSVAFEAAGLDRRDLSMAAHQFLARTGSAVALVQVDDLFGEIDQLNVPGTNLEYPNWRRRNARPVGDMLNVPSARTLLDIMRKERSG